MKKRNKKYVPKPVGNTYNKIAAMFSIDGHLPLNDRTLERFTEKYTELNKNLINNQAKIQDIMYMHGLLEQVNTIRKKSNIIEELDNYEFVLSIKDKIQNMIKRHNMEKDNFIGYIDDSEKEALNSLYELSIKTFSSLTNREYDLFVCELEKECIKNGNKLIRIDDERTKT